MVDEFPYGAGSGDIGYRNACRTGCTGYRTEDGESS